jgi:hypothetical protein
VEAMRFVAARLSVREAASGRIEDGARISRTTVSSSLSQKGAFVAVQHKMTFFGRGRPLYRRALT